MQFLPLRISSGDIAGYRSKDPTSLAGPPGRAPALGPVFHITGAAMADMPQQDEINAINEAFAERVAAAFATMCGQIRAAGPGGYYAAVEDARRSRDVALDFANQPIKEQPCVKPST